MVTEYRVSQALLVRLMGTFLVLVGAAVLLLALLVGLLSLPASVLTVGALVAAGAVVGVGFLLTWVAAVVRLDDEGYQVRLLRRAGVRRARWPEVEDVVAATLSGQRCLVIRLRDGRTTTVPAALVDPSAETLAQDLRTRLQRSGGRRR